MSDIGNISARLEEFSRIMRELASANRTTDESITKINSSLASFSATLEKALSSGVSTQAQVEEINKLTSAIGNLNKAKNDLQAKSVTKNPAGSKLVATSEFTDEDLAGLRQTSTANRSVANPTTANTGVPKLTKDLTEAQKAAALANKEFERVFQTIEKLGGSRTDLTRINESLNGSRKEFIFNKQDPTTGANIRQSAILDEYGNVKTPSQNKFRGTFQNITRDIGELAKWTLAVGVIYGPLRKVEEVMGEMVANEVKLAEATTAVNSAFASSSDIFNTAADAAQAAGETLSETINAFTMAYRATGGGSNEMDRFTTATKLMTDALTLSKLAGLDASVAIDTLSAALKQSSSSFKEGTNPLEQGSVLLDKWVRTTQVANVDLGTLSTGFAVLGDAADAAGINIDQLNGIIAAVAETGIASGREAANTARAIVSGFQSDKAQEELQRLGISVKDAEGNLRSFMDIMNQLSSMRKQGILGDTDFSRITLALGGGTRRQAAYATFIENLDRVYQVANASGNAKGEAGVALAKQLDTVQTAGQRLDNSFQKLGQTLGNSGGFLDGFKSVINLGTTLVDTLDRVVEGLGRATPLVVALGAAMAVLASQADKQKFLDKNLVSPLQSGINKAYYGIKGPYEGGTPMGQKVTDWLSGTTAGRLTGGAGIGLLAAAVPAISNFNNKNDQFGQLKGTADIAGGIVGGIVGSLAGPQGSAIGATIGVAISESFINNTIAYETKMANFFKTPEAQADSSKKSSQTAVQDYEKARESLFAAYGGGNNETGRFRAEQQSTALNSRIDQINQAIQSGDTKQIEKVFSGMKGRYGLSPELQKILSERGYTKEKALELSKTGGYFESFTPENLAYTGVGSKDQTRFRAAAEKVGAITGSTDLPSEFSRQLALTRMQNQAEISKASNERLKELAGQRSAGDIKSSTYSGMVGSVTGFSSLAGSQYLTAFGSEFQKMSKTSKDASSSIKDLLDVVTYGSPESVQELNSITSEIADLTSKAATLKGSDTIKIKIDGQDVDVTKKQLEEILAAKKELGASKAEQILLDVKIARANLPGITGSISDPMKGNDQKIVESMAKQMQDQYYSQFMDQSTYDETKKRFEDFSTLVEDGGKTFYKVIEGIDEKFYQAAQQKAEQEGKINNKGLGLGQYDVDRATLEKLAGKSLNMGQQWQQQFGYDYKPEQQVAIAKDGVAKPLKADFKILQLLLEKLVDLNQKQLDGMYNIPEGATFWVPLTAAYYKPGNKDNGLNSATDITTGEGDLAKKLADSVSQHVVVPKPYVDAEHQPSLSKDYKKPEVSDITKLDLLKGLDRGQYTDYKEPAKPPSMHEQYTTPAPANYKPDNAAAQGVSARLQLSIQNNTTVQVDGRAIANIVKTYLSNDFLRMSSAYGQSTKNYVT